MGSASYISNSRSREEIREFAIRTRVRFFETENCLQPLFSFFRFGVRILNLFIISESVNLPVLEKMMRIIICLHSLFDILTVTFVPSYLGNGELTHPQFNFIAPRTREIYVRSLGIEEAILPWV